MTNTETQCQTSTLTSTPCGYGEFCWFECNSRDMKRASKFYTDLLGGEASDCPHSPTPYMMIAHEGHHSMGLMEMGSTFPAEIPAHWMGYIAVSDIVATSAGVTGLGGSLCVPVTDIGIGRFCVVTDPTGARVSLFQAHEGKTDGVNWNGQGFVGWNELITSDPKAAAKFYCALLGWTATESSDFGFPYWMFSANGRPVGGCIAKCPDDKSPRSYWLQYLQVNSIDTSHARVTSVGGKSLCEVMTIPGIGRTGYYTDPNGAVFALWEPAKAAPKGDSCSCCCGH